MKYFALALLLLLPFECFASLEVESTVIGLSGYVRPERWIPAVFQIHNTGPSFIGTLEVMKGDTVFRKSLDLGTGMRKRVEILYFHSNYYEPLSYKVLDEKRRPVVENRIDVQVLNYMDNLLLVLSAREYNHQFLNGQQNPWGGKTFVSYMKPQDMFSEWIAYSAADAIAVGSLSTGEVLPGQLRALFQYVASGGILVCTPATDLSILQHPYLRNDLPDFSVDLNRTTSGEFLVREWNKVSTMPFPEFTLPIRTLRKRPSDAEIQILDPDTSIVLSSPYYKGNITLFAYDYTQLPEGVRTFFARYWNTALFPISSTGQPMFSQPFRKRLEDNPKVQRFLYDIPGLRLPDVKWFALFFFIYLCAIGPLQYFILRTSRKNSILWITFPAVILLFTVSSFAYGKFRHSGERRITQVTVIELFPGISDQTVYQVYGTTLEHSGEFRFQAIPENSFLRKFAFQSLSYQPEPYILSEDLPRQLEGERIKNWTFRTFDAFSSEPIKLPITVNIAGNEQVLHGEVHNDSDFDIDRSFFLFDTRNVAMIGTIPRHSKRAFSVALNNKTAPPMAEPHLRDLLHLYVPVYADPHFLFGEIRDSKGELLINGRSRTTYCTKYIAVYVNTGDAGRRHRLAAGLF